jgi:hypothetical protein
VTASLGSFLWASAEMAPRMNRRQTMTNSTHPYSIDDIAVWPDGWWATLGAVWNGQHNHRSDDYEIVHQDDVARLKELGLAEGFDIP